MTKSRNEQTSSAVIQEITARATSRLCPGAMGGADRKLLEQLQADCRTLLDMYTQLLTTMESNAELEDAQGGLSTVDIDGVKMKAGKGRPKKAVAV